MLSSVSHSPHPLRPITCSPQMSFSNLFLVDLTDTDTSIGALEEGREVMAMSPLEPAPFVSSGVFIYIEQVCLFAWYFFVCVCYFLPCFVVYCMHNLS